MSEILNQNSHYVYFNNEELYDYPKLLKLFSKEDEKELIGKFREEFRSLGMPPEEWDSFLKNKLKKKRSNLILNRISLLKEKTPLQDLGILWKIDSDTDYWNIKSKFTFTNEDNEQVCFLRDISISSKMEIPSNVLDLYQLLRDEISKKEQFRQKINELQERISILETDNTKKGIKPELKEQIQRVFDLTLKFFGDNKELIKEGLVLKEGVEISDKKIAKKGNPLLGPQLFSEMKKVRDQINEMK